MLKKIVLQLLVCFVFLFTATHLAAKSEAADGSVYKATEKEYYLSSDEIFFIRPGLEIEVVDFVIPADLQPVVTFSLQDPGGLPLDIDGVFTPGPVDMRYYLTYIPMGEEFKVRYTDSTRDSGGVITPLGDGIYTYQFATVLPADYQVDATHTLGLVGRRDLQEFDLDRYVDNVVHNFVPSGNGDPVPRDIVTTETCNGRCHDPLAEHGGRYREIGICTQCHNPQLTGRRDPTASKDFSIVVHEAHELLEEGYPTQLNDCETCHTGGTPTAAFPLVATANPVPVCDGTSTAIAELNWADIGGPLEIRVGPDGASLFASAQDAGSKMTGKWVGDGLDFSIVDRDAGETLQEIKVNTTVLGCVGNAPGSSRGLAAAQHSNWLDHPSRAVCGSCHTDVNFATGEGHSAAEISQVDDQVCDLCHVPDTGKEFDRSIRGAHKVGTGDWGGVYKSAQTSGILLQFVGITDTDPGDFPTVTYSLHSKKGAIAPSTLNRLLFNIAGPNTDFNVLFQEDPRSGSIPLGGGNWSYTFGTPIPAGAMGSYTVGVEGREQVVIDMGAEDSTERNALEASLLPFAVTGDMVPRREIVDDAKCENCHNNVSFHGGNRTNAQYCTTCHNPAATDVNRRPASEMPAESIHFKTMIHGIHSGEELDNGLVIYGYGGTKHDFGHIEFPGDLRNCENCHLPGTYNLPLPAGALPTPDLDGFFSPLFPETAACVSCHDSDSTRVHAFNNTAFFGEACATCHGVNSEFAVDKVHAR